MYIVINCFLLQASDENNNKHVIDTYAYNKDIIRDAGKVEEEMLRRGLIKKAVLGIKPDTCECRGCG